MPKNSSNPRNAPPAYRPQPVPKVLQQKSALTNRQGQVTITQPALKWSPERVTGVAKMGAAGQQRGQAMAGSSAGRPGSIREWSPALFPKSTGTVQAAKKKKKPKAESKAEKTWKNLICYSKNKAELVAKEYPNDYLEVMREFVAYYKDGIRGHCSGGGGDAQNAQTTQDLQAFNTWYKANKKK